MLSHDEQAIVAQCTPKGTGALALIRLSGNNAVEIADTVAKLPRQKKLATALTHTIHYGTILTPTRESIDTVLFLLMRAPETFTGQDTVEITCHNNPFIIQMILATLINGGARMAQEGEFSKRAVLHNKIDLIQAEAINELIHANSQHTLKQSLAQLQGSFSNHIAALEKNLITALAYTDASFEFIDEEHLEFNNTIELLLRTTAKTIDQLLQSFDQQKQVREGIRIALIGSVNAGKSSLFNAIVGTNRSIVTEHPGTTRDVIEASFYDEGLYWTFADTAGLRQTNDVIEQEGIKRSYEQASKADIILLIVDSSRAMSAEEKEAYAGLYQDFTSKTVVFYNKTDLACKAPALFAHSIEGSANDPVTIAMLMTTLRAQIKKLFTASSPYLLNERHYNILLQLKNELGAIFPLLGTPTIAYELISYHLQQAIAQCAEITGKSARNRAFEAVFKEFCIGK